MAISNGQTSGSSSTAAGASSNLSWQPKGTILVADGAGNVGGSATINEGSIVQTIQHFRVNYTPVGQDWANLYVNLLISLPTPYTDTNYTVNCTLEINTAALPIWQANTLIQPNTAIFDPVTKTIQFAMNSATTGATKPSFGIQPDALTSDGAQRWENETGSFSALLVQGKTPQNFTMQFLLYQEINPTPIPIIPFVINVLVFHD
jgi:hypothetical protein